MRVRLWGTRGSIATPGGETMRYGGNTSCVEVVGEDGTTLILDAGTGIYRLGQTLRPVERLDVLLTHLHMDHIQGLGFFEPLFKPGLQVHVWGPESFSLDLRGRLSRYLSPPLFPVRLRDFRCELTLHDVMCLDGFQVGSLEVTIAPVIHPGPTVGYRIREGGSTLAYIPDHEPALGFDRLPADPGWTSGWSLAEDADLLIHDAQYTAEEYPNHVGWGHSSLDHVLEFAKRCRVKTLVPFHHDPAHTDAMLDCIFGEWVSRRDLPFHVVPAMEGAFFHLDPEPRSALPPSGLDERRGTLTPVR